MSSASSSSALVDGQNNNNNMDTSTDQPSTHLIPTQRTRTPDSAIAYMATCLLLIKSKIGQMQTHPDVHSETHGADLAFLCADREESPASQAVLGAFSPFHVGAPTQQSTIMDGL
jgi:hypothetical protein